LISLFRNSINIELIKMGIEVFVNNAGKISVTNG